MEYIFLLFSFNLFLFNAFKQNVWLDTTGSNPLPLFSAYIMYILLTVHTYSTNVRITRRMKNLADKIIRLLLSIENITITPSIRLQSQNLKRHITGSIRAENCHCRCHLCWSCWLELKENGQNKYELLYLNWQWKISFMTAMRIEPFVYSAMTYCLGRRKDGRKTRWCIVPCFWSIQAAGSHGSGVVEQMRGFRLPAILVLPLLQASHSSDISGLHTSTLVQLCSLSSFVGLNLSSAF
jgi:hypothetical protein